MIEFLTNLFHSGLGYSALNTARGALSSLGLVYEGFTAGSHPLVIRFLKGVYNLRPPKPRYTHTWDVSVVLQYLRTLSPVKTLSLKNLTLKLVMLISLTCATRLQSIHCLKLHNMTKKKSSFEFCYDELLKTSRPNFVVPKTILKAYAPDRRLCVFTVMCEYLSRTVTLRTCDSLFISFVKPYKAVTRDTLARWIRTVMCAAGVDTDLFKAHSVRSASVSKAKACHVPIDDIMRKAGWSNVETFRKYYDKEVVVEKFAEAVLNN